MHNNHNKRIVEPKFCPFSGQISFSGRFPRYDRFTILYKRPVVLSGVTNTMYNINNFRNKSSLTKLMKAIWITQLKKKKSLIVEEMRQLWQGQIVMSRGTLNNGRWWIGFCNGGIKGETGQTTKQPFLSLLNLASSPFPDPESIAFLECYGRFWFPHKDHSDNNENEISQHYSSTQILFTFDFNAVLNLDRLIILYILLRKSSIFI